MSKPPTGLQNDPPDKLWWELEKWVNNFYIGLLLIAVLAGSILIYMLMLDLGELNPGTRVLFAGIAGIIGSCLAPLLDQKSYSPLKSSKDFNVDQVPRVFTQQLIYTAGGFGVSAAAFVITSALLTREPGTSANDLGTVTFGSIVGFVLGHSLKRRTLSWVSEKPEELPVVVSALGDLEDQLFGRSLLNYDGYVVATWQASKPSSRTAGQLLVYMTDHKPPEMPDDPGPDDLPYAYGRVLLQGGRNADLVPFAISIVDVTFNVQPQRFVIAAPTKGKSEPVSFTFLNIDKRLVEGNKNTETKQSLSENKPQMPSLLSNASQAKPIVSVILIDVSQAGRTVLLFEMEISI